MAETLTSIKKKLFKYDFFIFSSSIMYLMFQTINKYWIIEVDIIINIKTKAKKTMTKSAFSYVSMGANQHASAEE